MSTFSSVKQVLLCPKLAKAVQFVCYQGRPRMNEFGSGSATFQLLSQFLQGKGSRIFGLIGLNCQEMYHLLSIYRSRCSFLAVSSGSRWT
jgi:hypothetical protein